MLLAWFWSLWFSYSSICIMGLTDNYLICTILWISSNSCLWRAQPHLQIEKFKNWSNSILWVIKLSGVCSESIQLFPDKFLPVECESWGVKVWSMCYWIIVALSCVGTSEAIVEGMDRDVVYNAVISYNLIWSVVLWSIVIWCVVL